MSEAATGNYTLQANIPHPTCDVITFTDQCSSDVKIGGIGVVRKGDMVAPHTIKIGKICVVHSTPLVSFSSSVRVNGKGVGRKNDMYGCGCRILSGNSKINIGG